MPTGFSNEKSAEYVILNNLYEKVKDNCSFFYPFIFQSRRDDTFVSLENEIDDLRLIICFARRPKVKHLGDDNVIVTFRETLFRRTEYFRMNNVDSIIGVPIGSRIEEIGFGARCQWFYQQDLQYDFNQISLDKRKPSLQNSECGLEILTDSMIYDLFKNAPIMKWARIIEVLREWYLVEKDLTYSRLFLSIPGQRPIFIAYKLKNQ